MKKKKILVFISTVLLGFSIFLYKNNISDNKKYVSSQSSIKNKSHHTHKINLSPKKTIKLPKEVLNHKTGLLTSENNEIRKFPFPYKAMLSICSDIDDTTLEEFKRYHKFLNTKEDTPYGKGLGFDVGDSFWMYMADNMNFKVDKQNHGVDHIMTFWKGIDTNSPHNAKDIIKFIKCGWIDSIHTFGDFSTDDETNTKFNRTLAIKALKKLQGLNISVWINHGNRANTQNFGSGTLSKFMSYQEGDKKDSKYYHTDLSLKNNIKYIWNSLNRSAFGVDYPLYKITLRDGQKVWGFSRHTNYIKNEKIDWTWNTKHLHRQLTKKNLDSIVTKNQYSIIAQHLGIASEDLFSSNNIQSLKLLKDYENKGKILVARTSRLLNFANAQKHLVYKKVVQKNKTYINIISVNDPIFGTSKPTLNNVRGLTFYCNNPNNTILILNDKVIPKQEIQINPKDKDGKPSISIKWFKPNYKDYTSI